MKTYNIVALCSIAFSFTGIYADDKEYNDSSYENMTYIVAEKSGRDYDIACMNLVASVRNDLKSYEEECAASTNWRVRMLSAIISERIKKDNVIRRVNNNKVKYDSILQSSEIIYGRALASAYGEVPMYIAEALWKGNDMVKYVKGKKAVTLAAAIKSMPPNPVIREYLEYTLINMPFEEIREGQVIDGVYAEYYISFVCGALAKNADSRSLPLLLEIVMNRSSHFDDDKYHLGTYGLCEAIYECANEGSVPCLNQVKSRVAGYGLRNYIEVIIEHAKTKKQNDKSD